MIFILKKLLSADVWHFCFKNKFVKHFVPTFVLVYHKKAYFHLNSIDWFIDL